MDRLCGLRQRLTSSAVVTPIQPVDVPRTHRQAVLVACLRVDLGGKVGAVVQVGVTHAYSSGHGSVVPHDDRQVAPRGGCADGSSRAVGCRVGPDADKGEHARQSAAEQAANPVLFWSPIAPCQFLDGRYGFDQLEAVRVGPSVPCSAHRIICIPYPGPSTTVYTPQTRAVLDYGTGGELHRRHHLLVE